jgi:hypothetical protein
VGFDTHHFSLFAIRAFLPLVCWLAVRLETSIMFMFLRDDDDDDGCFSTARFDSIVPSDFRV